VHYLPDLDDLEDALLAELRSGDLCLTMGAGDLTELPDKLLARLR
jgi:UDP-N-acetylmuramate-alanine ligase